MTRALQLPSVTLIGWPHDFLRLIEMDYTALKFPKGFLWGSAASAHQAEGHNNNDWTEWEKIPGKIKDRTNSNVACDHYNRYPEDFDLARQYGHQIHRFSVEWSRIEPKQGVWNDKEIKHYRDVVQALNERGIKPMVTLHHFTNPLWFRDIRSWLNPQSPELFTPYCRKIADAFSDLGVIWTTINEPMVVVAAGYLYGEFPPGMKDYASAMTVARHLLMAHGRASEQIREVYRDKGLERPQVAPVLSVSHFMPADPSNPEDVELAQNLDELYNHRWVNGLLKAEIPDSPDTTIEYPPLKDSADFIGLNYYSRMLVSSRLDFFAGEMPAKDPALERCEGLDWEVYPAGYYHILKSFWEKYRKPIFLTENGIGTRDDKLRCRYIITHLQQVHRAMQEGVDILGYIVWSLTDNFEWTQGYSSHFGLIEVDYKTLRRKPKPSAEMFHEIIRANGLSKALQKKYLG